MISKPAQLSVGKGEIWFTRFVVGVGRFWELTVQIFGS